MPATIKSKTLMGAAKRFELWLIYGAVFSFLALCVLWNLGSWVDDPLARLVFTGLLVIGYAVIAVLVLRFYDKDGVRIRVRAAAAKAPEAVSTE